MSFTVIPDTQTTDFTPLFADQDEATILQRMIDWANEGLDPVADADQWVDTREGAHWRTGLFSAVREFARIYDKAGTEVPMSAFVLWAWGQYLDDLAAQYQVVRRPATVAEVTVTFDGTPGTEIAVSTTVGTLPGTPDDPAPEFEVTTAGTIPGGGSIDLPAQATEPGAAGNVGAGAITVPITPLPNVTVITNAAPSFGGSDVESDESLRQRTLDAIGGKGPGAQRDYVRWAEAWPGVGLATVVPVWAGAGTVLVDITDENGQPLPSSVVDDLQNDLDPVAGMGSGTAPVGATVTVATPAVTDITVVPAGIVYEAGYSWDGAGDTTAVGPGITDAIKAYFLKIPPGDEVVHARVLGLVAAYPGVHDLTGVTINGATANIAITLSPPHVAVLVEPIVPV